jgi:hypothetical protein
MLLRSSRRHPGLSCNWCIAAWSDLSESRPKSSSCKTEYGEEPVCCVSTKCSQAQKLLPPPTGQEQKRACHGAFLVLRAVKMGTRLLQAGSKRPHGPISSSQARYRSQILKNVCSSNVPVQIKGSSGRCA